MKAVGARNGARETLMNRMKASDDVYTIQTDLVSQNEHKLVNLSNQLEYIFEIKTQELDPTAEIRPALN